MTKEEYNEKLKLLFSSDLGLEVLALWKDEYVDNMQVSMDTHRTYLNLGQQLFVQSLLNAVKRDKRLDEIITEHYADMFNNNEDNL